MTYAQFDVSLVWLRRDLRLDDHAALYHALKSSRAVYVMFVFDTDILDALPSRHDRRVEFIHDSLIALKHELEALGTNLHVLHGPAARQVPEFALSIGAQAVFCNRDYEPAEISLFTPSRIRLSSSGTRCLRAQARHMAYLRHTKMPGLENSTPFI